MKENIRIATEFSEKVKGSKGVVSTVLFGSVARGEDKIDSDIDIAIIYEGNDKYELMKQVNKQKHERIQTTFVHVKELYKEAELSGALSGEGLLLHGRPIIIKAGKLELKPKSIVSYSLSKLPQTTKVKVNRALYGSTSKSNYKEKRYVTKTFGLTKEPGIEKLNKGVLLVERKKATKIVNMLKRFGAECKEIVVWSY